jgi:RNA polymerase sigma factor (sigma-70 family)
MNEAKKFRIRIPGTLVEVTREVYLTYYRMDRHVRHLEEKDADHGRVLYSDMDTEELVGEEAIPDLDSPAVEDEALDRVMKDKLWKCLPLLTKQEMELIDGLYFQKLSENQLASKTGIPSMTIHNRKVRILRKLKKLLEK